jgi:phage shock protein PspC (stress-responsive transcriptional regulator)
MSLSDDMARLHDLHQRGALSDDEFARAKRTLLDGAPPPAMAAMNALRRSRSDRWVAGVCAGIAQALGLDAWVVRLLFAALLVWGGAGLLVYLLLWIFVPSE